MHPDSKVECQPDCGCTLVPALILEGFVIWPKTQLSRFQVMLRLPFLARKPLKKFVTHPDSRTECQPDWCPALVLSLTFNQSVIRPKHQFSHFQVMLIQDGLAL